MGKFYLFLLAGAATGIWYAMYREPTQSSHDPLESLLTEMHESKTFDAAHMRNTIHKLALMWYEKIETLNCTTEKTDNMGWATPPAILAKIENLTTGAGAWGCGNYRVYVDKLGSTDTTNQISWNRGDDFVDIMEYWDNVICQSWLLGGAVVLIKWSPDDDSGFECWMLEKATMAYLKKKEYTNYKWIDGKKDVQALRTYRQHMFRWCEQNGEWIARRRLPCLLHALKDEDIF